MQNRRPVTRSMTRNRRLATRSMTRNRRLATRSMTRNRRLPTDPITKKRKKRRTLQKTKYRKKDKSVKWKISVVSKKNRKVFMKKMESVFYCDENLKTKCNLLAQCNKKNSAGKSKELINRNYFGENNTANIDYLMFYEEAENATSSKIAKTKQFIVKGFLAAHVKDVDGLKIFYIDLVCSRHKKGKALLERAEFFAKNTLRCKTIALRAAYAVLIPLYGKYGYRRVANDCAKRSVEQRRILRGLDEKKEIDGWWMSKCL